MAQAQYSSLLEGLRAVGQVKGWQTQHIVFVGGTCGSVHVESFNKNMKALGVLESKWNPICQKLVRWLLEEQDKVLRSYFAQKGGTRGQRGEGTHGDDDAFDDDVFYLFLQKQKIGAELHIYLICSTKVGSMSSGTCTGEVRAECVRNQDA